MGFKGYLVLTVQGVYFNPNIKLTGGVQQSNAIKGNENSFNVQTHAIGTKQAGNAHVSAPFVGQYSTRQLINAYANKNYINSLIQANPKLQSMLKANGLENTIHPENVRLITNSHLTQTTAYALQIANAMGIQTGEKRTLEQACMFHDFGKILIPKEIVNKAGALTKEEKQTMDLHAELGYELLSQTNMNKRVLNLIKNHHMPVNANNDVLGQILSVADIYSALREERSYKAPLSEKEALEILDQKAKAGEVSTEVVNTLKQLKKAS